MASPCDDLCFCVCQFCNILFIFGFVSKYNYLFVCNQREKHWLASLGMPREHQPRRGAAARGANQTVFGKRAARGSRATVRPPERTSPSTASSSNMSISSEPSTAALQFSQIFPTFNSSVQDAAQKGPMANEEAMAQKLREHVFAALNQGPQVI